MLIRIILSSLLLSLVAAGKTKITVPVTTTVSPNGKKIAFSWNEDLWQVSIDGGKASRLTTHPASEYYPKFTPDGKSLLFSSNRNGANQVFKKNLVTGAITQLTKHTETTQLQDISPNGKEFLSLSLRDGTGRNAMRFYSHSLDNPEVETQLFDTYGKFAKYSADGKKIIFAREGVQTYRKGYIGTFSTISRSKLEPLTSTGTI